ncbi:hypothetical protein ACFL0P_01680 [Candidatus Omnitrophota bacterium]
MKRNSQKEFHDVFIRDISINKISKVLDKKLLKEIYHKNKIPLGDIAKEFNCSKSYIYKLCKKYGISLRAK